VTFCLTLRNVSRQSTIYRCFGVSSWVVILLFCRGHLVVF